MEGNELNTLTSFLLGIFLDMLTTVPFLAFSVCLSVFEHL